MPKILRRTQFGNPILRQKTRELSAQEIVGKDIQELLANMRYTLEKKRYGVGLAATQVGYRVAVSLISIKPTPSRPDSEKFELVIINPKITKTYGTKEPMWEGCISFGGTKDFPYAQVPRYKKVRLRYYDETGALREKDFEGLSSHVIQHEVDHLNGVLFVDRVEDTTTYVTVAEYRKRYAKR